MTAAIQEYADQINAAYEDAIHAWERQPRMGIVEMFLIDRDTFGARYNVARHAYDTALGLAEDRGQDWEWAMPRGLPVDVERFEKVIASRS